MDRSRDNQAEPARRRKRRRWGRIVLLVFAGLLIVAATGIACLPRLISTSFGTRTVVRAINGAIRGQVDIDRLSTSWSGPTELAGLRLIDEDGRVVLETKRAQWSAGLWQAVRSPQQFHEIAAEEPDVTFYVNEAGQISLARALELRESRPKPLTPTPIEIDRIAVRNGRLRIVQPDRPAMEFHAVATDAAIRTLRDLGGQLTFRLPEGPAIRGQFSVQNLLNDRGQVQLGQATILGRLESDAPIEIRDITAIATPDMPLAGTVSFDVQAEVHQGKGAVSFAFTGRGLTRGETRDAGVPPALSPLDVVVEGQWNVSPEAIDGSLRLAVGDQVAGVTLQGRVPLDVLDDLLTFDRDTLRAALEGYLACAMIEGQDVALPPFDVTGSGYANLVRVSRLLGDLVPWREGFELRGGRVELGDFAFRGGAKPSLTAAVSVTGLRGRLDGQWVSLPDSSLSLDAAVEPDQGLSLRYEVSAGDLASLAVQGTMDRFDARVRTDLDACVSSLRQFVTLPEFELHGVLAGSLEGARSGDEWRISPDVSVSGFRFIAFDPLAAGVRDGRPVEVLLKGEVDISPRAATGHFGLHDEAGNLGHGDIGYVGGEFRLPLTEDWRWSRDWLSAVLAGDRVSMPAFEFSGGMDVDLARVEEAVPGLLGMRRDFRLTSGALKITSLHLAGGERPHAAGQIELTLFGSRDGRAISLHPLTADLDISLSAGEGLAIASADVRGAGLTVRANGSPTGTLSAEFRMEGIAFFKELSQLMTLPDCIAGDVAGSLTITPCGPDLSDLYVSLEATADGVDIPLPPGPIRVARGRLTHEGEATLDSKRLTRYETSRTTLTLDEDVESSVDGWVDFANGSLEAMLRWPRANLSAVGSWARGLGLPIPPDLTGTSQGQWTITLAAGQDTLVSSGKTVIDDVTLQRDGQRGAGVSPAPTVPLAWTFENVATASQPEQLDGLSYPGQWSAQRGRDARVTLGRFELTHDNVRVRGDWREIRAGSLRLEHEAATLEATDGRLSLGAAARERAWEQRIGGEVTAAFSTRLAIRADLARARATALAVGTPERIPALAGRLDAAGEFAVIGPRMQATLSASVEPFTLGEGETAWSEPRVTFGGEASFDVARNELTLSRASVDVPGLVNVTTTGTVRGLPEQPVVSLAVDYRGEWAKAVERLHQFVPTTRETVSVTGTTAGTFHISGPLRSRTETLMGLRTDPAIQFVTGRFYGFELGAADLAPTLAGGKLTLPMTRIPGGGDNGVVSLGGELDLTGTTPVLRIPGTVRLLDRVAINRQIGEEWLSRVNPILGSTNKLEGTLTLETTDLVLPLGRDLLTGGSGKGRLDLSRIEVSPKGFLGDLLGLAGLDISRGSLLLRPQGVEFEIRDGRVHYEDFRISAGLLDLVFRGSVGFDDSVEMWVSMPVSRQLLGLFELGLPTDHLLRLIGDIRVEIPIRGTRLAPTLDVGSLNPLRWFGR